MSPNVLCKGCLSLERSLANCYTTFNVTMHFGFTHHNMITPAHLLFPVTTSLYCCYSRRFSHCRGTAFSLETAMHFYFNSIAFLLQHHNFLSSSCNSTFFPTSTMLPQQQRSFSATTVQLSNLQQYSFLVTTAQSPC